VCFFDSVSIFLRQLPDLIHVNKSCRFGAAEAGGRRSGVERRRAPMKQNSFCPVARGLSSSPRPGQGKLPGPDHGHDLATDPKKKS
jgi:hypothetical protein